MPSFVDLSGKTFSRLSVVRRGENRGNRVFWVCACKCGEVVEVAANKLPNGHTRSCGCLQREESSKVNLKHGQTSYPNGGSATKEYNTWAMMHRRCKATTGKDYHHYGARGIVVCDRWQNFVNFYSDMGKAPSAKHSIDRVDNNGPYSPDNCKWSTQVEQRRNRRDTVLISCRGKALTPAEWAIETGVNNKLIYARIKRGWTVEKALFTQV